MLEIMTITLRKKRIMNVHSLMILSSLPLHLTILFLRLPTRQKVKMPLLTQSSVGNNRKKNRHDLENWKTKSKR